MPTRLFTASFLLILVTVAVPGAVQAGNLDDAVYRRLNAALVESHVLPRYRRLVEATVVLDQQTARFCAAPDGPGLAALRGAFHQGFDAFQGVQHIRFGPVELFMRSMRLAFWPDPRNAASRQMEPILEGRDANAITQDSFDHGSVAIQGFPAIERLLFDDDVPPPWPANEQGAFRCQYLRAIAANLTHMARDILIDWTTGRRPYTTVFTTAGSEGNPYPTNKDATLDLFRGLVAAVELAAERKLARPLGETLEKARPRLAESWRSGRSLENIRRNLEAAEALYLGEGGFGFSSVVREAIGDAELDDLLRHAFTQTRETARSVTLPLRDAIGSDAMRPRLEQLLTEMTALRALLSRRLAPVLGVPVGFNSLDGD